MDVVRDFKGFVAELGAHEEQAMSRIEGLKAQVRIFERWRSRFSVFCCSVSPTVFYNTPCHHIRTSYRIGTCR